MAQVVTPWRGRRAVSGSRADRRSAAYPALAGERLEARGVAVELVRSDMRELVRPESFEVAINLFTSLGYFRDAADDVRVLLASTQASCRAGSSWSDGGEGAGGAEPHAAVVGRKLPGTGQFPAQEHAFPAGARGDREPLDRDRRRRAARVQFTLRAYSGAS
ncbi:MAG: hypothetical protein IPK07_24405 [Deltaproteobacteria bacterium]|nr:hypothetical protein [Deltaproteobacteria bacterium]